MIDLIGLKKCSWWLQKCPILAKNPLIYLLESKNPQGGPIKTSKFQTTAISTVFYIFSSNLMRFLCINLGWTGWPKASIWHKKGIWQASDPRKNSSLYFALKLSDKFSKSCANQAGSLGNIQRLKNREAHDEIYANKYIHLCLLSSNLKSWSNSNTFQTFQFIILLVTRRISILEQLGVTK